MTWRKLEDTFYDSPKIKRLARHIDAGFDLAAGKIALLWTWSLRHAPDGDLSRYETEDIEDAVHWTGARGDFVDACVRVGLIDDDNGSISIHNWVERGGTFAESKRRQQHRRRHKMSQDVTGHPVTSRDEVALSQDVPGCHVLEEKRIEENRREEKQLSGSAAEATGLDVRVSPKVERDDIQEVWQHYRTHHPRAPQQLKANRKEYRLIRDRLQDFGADDLKRAIDGYHRSPWHNGANERQTKYLSLDLMMRDIGHVQSGLEFAGTAEGVNNQPRKLDGLQLLGDTGD